MERKHSSEFKLLPIVRLFFPSRPLAYTNSQLITKIIIIHTKSIICERFIHKSLQNEYIEGSRDGHFSL